MPDSLNLTRRTTLIALLIMCMAFCLRLGVIAQRINADDPVFALLVGTDEYTYYHQARGVLNGTFPHGVFYFHPAIAYGFAGIMALVGDDLLMARIGVSLFDSLIVGIMIANGWLLTRRAWGGYIVGMLWAVYPMALFYSTTFWDSPLSAGYLALTIFFALWQREKLTLWRTLLLGFLAGWMTATRMNLAPMMLFWLMWAVWLTPDWRVYARHAAAFTIVMILTIAPFTWWNYQITDGSFIPVATTGDFELYMGNNRASTGRHGLNNATDSLDTNAFNAIWRDVRVDTRQMIGLWSYKFASFWHNNEYGNGYNYEDVFARAPLIRLVPIQHSALAVMSLLGLALLWMRDRLTALYLGSLLGWLIFSLTVTFIFSRMRFPSTVLLILLTGYALHAIIGYARHWRDYRLPDFKQNWRRYAPIALALVMGISLYGIAQLESDIIPGRTYTSLPDDAIVINVMFADADGDAVELVGWRPMTRGWSASEQGWTTSDNAYAIELFWRAVRPLDIDYAFSLAYVVNRERMFGAEQRLGNVSYPPRMASTWDTTTIHGEIVALKMPRDAVANFPYANSGLVTVSVFEDALTEEGILRGLRVTSPADAPNVTLQMMAWYPANIPPYEVPNYTPVGQVFGREDAEGTIRLMGKRVQIPTRTSENARIAVAFYWEALTNVREEINIFLHLMDTDGNLIQQYDASPNQLLLTQNWMLNYPVATLMHFDDVPAGTYELYLGMYRVQDFERLYVPDSIDNRYLLEIITIPPHEAQ